MGIIWGPLRMYKIWRQGWILYPEIMAPSLLAVIGAIIIIGANMNPKEEWKYKKYKTIPTIVRPDDPKALKIRNTSMLDSFP